VKILVTGADNMLGRDIMSQLIKDPEVLGVKQGGLDVSDYDRVRDICLRYRPVVIIHTHAMHGIDECETNPADALRLNALGTHNLALAALEVDAAMLYVSADTVFSGNKKGPYAEWDAPDPISVHGHSRHAAETMVSQHLQKFFIVRSSGLYGKHGDSFVLELLQAARDNKEIRVPNDEFILPTYTHDLANAIARLSKTKFYGTYHITNTGERTGIAMSDWAQMILTEAGLDHVKIAPVPGAALERPARRPQRVVLGNTFYRLRQLPAMRSCKEALKAFIKEVAKSSEPVGG
jgi:dTDP-4-dehydrorhamnose reductase